MAKAGKKLDAIRAEHLANSLHNIEVWCRRLREIVGQLDPDMVLVAPNQTVLARKEVVPKVSIGCPPPDDECEEDDPKSIRDPLRPGKVRRLPRTPPGGPKQKKKSRR